MSMDEDDMDGNNCGISSVLVRPIPMSLTIPSQSVLKIEPTPAFPKWKECYGLLTFQRCQWLWLVKGATCYILMA